MKEIPLEAAKTVAELCECDAVIVIGMSECGNPNTQITFYGKDAISNGVAEIIADEIKTKCMEE